MTSVLAFDGNIKKGDMNEQGLYARETPYTSSSLGHRNEQCRADRYDNGNRPNSEPMTVIHHEPNLIASETYILSRSGHLESNVDHWMGNDTTERDNFQNQWREQEAGTQHSSMSAQSSGTLSNIWYILTLLPLLGDHRRGWCSPRTSIMAMLNTVDYFATYIKQVVSRLRTQLATIAIDQIYHGCFTAGMDVLLTVHALVFLIVSIYQSSTFGNNH